MIDRFPLLRVSPPILNVRSGRDHRPDRFGFRPIHLPSRSPEFLRSRPGQNHPRNPVTTQRGCLWPIEVGFPPNPRSPIPLPSASPDADVSSAQDDPRQLHPRCFSHPTTQTFNIHRHSVPLRVTPVLNSICRPIFLTCPTFANTRQYTRVAATSVSVLTCHSVVRSAPTPGQSQHCSMSSSRLRYLDTAKLLRTQLHGVTQPISGTSTTPQQGAKWAQLTNGCDIEWILTTLFSSYKIASPGPTEG